MPKVNEITDILNSVYQQLHLQWLGKNGSLVIMDSTWRSINAFVTIRYNYNAIANGLRINLDDVAKEFDSVNHNIWTH